MKNSPDHKTFKELLDHATKPSASQDEFENALSALRKLATREVFDRASAMCKDSNPRLREIGVQILCQLGEDERKFADDTLSIFLNLLEKEKDHTVLAAVGWGLGHLGKDFPLTNLIKLKKHSDPNVRLGVVGGLLSNSNEIAIQTLIELSDDTDSRVRNWATAGLGMMCEVDREDIREALFRRLSDTDEETRLEALYGLAKRRDLRVVDMLLSRLSPETADYLDVLSAESLAHPKLLASLLRLESSWNGVEEVLQRAIESCRQGR